MKKTKNIVLVSMVGAFLLGLSVWNWAKPAEEFSDAERRYLKEFPVLSIETIENATFMQNFEGYVLDQFPIRDIFRGIKSVVADKVFMQKDVNDLYTYDGHIVSMEYPMNQDSIDWAAGKIEHIYKTFLEETETKIYVSMIPDKNYFLAEDSGHLSMDYDLFEKEVVEGIPFATYIDIMSSLSAEQYYKTDSHWNQTTLLPVAEVLLRGMGNEASEVYERVDLEKPFYGVYHGQLARKIAPDKLSYLTNDMLEGCKVFDYQNNKEIPMYDIEKTTSKDPYELFLGGPLSLLTIENPKWDEKKELVIFRDSFGSSIAPLLVESYGKITLVDIRYMMPALIEKFVTFDNQDVLFLYSTSVLNHSSTMK